VVVVRTTADDWQDLRDVRLAALADSPRAFGSTREREQAYGEGDWREWLRTSVVFLARSQGAPVGMAAGLDGETAEERQLVAMWVDPPHRGAGIGSQLVEHVCHWARDAGAVRLVLWIADGNDAARHLYRRHGFTGTGTSKPLPSNPAISEEQMVRQLR
jgi:GNAT superfamily N-acetyltransferase